MPSTSSTPTAEGAGEAEHHGHDDPGPRAVVVDVVGLDRLVQLLRQDGRTVVAPVVGTGGGAIVLDEIDSADHLPWGYADDQGPGHYRLRRAGVGEAFGFAAPAESWKRFVHPPETTLFTATRSGDGGLDVEAPADERPDLAFLGVRSCDLAGLRILDQALHAPPGPSPRHRGATDPSPVDPSPLDPSPLDDVFIVAVTCGRPSDSCFCVSQGTGPRPGPGFDVALTELADGRGHEFLLEAGTDRGRAVLTELRGRAADDGDRVRAQAVVDRARVSMGRTLAPDAPRGAAHHPEHPRWDDVADRCLACANCTLVCPTCFCTSVEDRTDVTGTTASRHQVWDSCFSSSFSDLNGVPVRSATTHRYRQWLLHKLVTWYDQFGSSGCVGCGRCITWCPVGIDLTAEAAALARTPGEDGA